MNTFRIIWLFFLLSCTSISISDEQKVISLLQKSWDTKKIELVTSHLGTPQITEQEAGVLKYSYFRANEKQSDLGTLSLFVDKQNKKIISIIFWLSNGSVPFVQNVLRADDWKEWQGKNSTNHHSFTDNYVVFSDKLGVSYQYDRYDQQKEVRIIYWGMDHMNIKL